MYDDGVIREAARRIVAAAPGARVILFGSHARGEAREDSDLDLLVIERTVDDAPREEVRLRRTLRGLGLFADVVVVSTADAERLRSDPSSVVGVALTLAHCLFSAERVNLYGKPGKTERRRLGEIATLEPRQTIPITLSWRNADRKRTELRTSRPAASTTLTWSTSSSAARRDVFVSRAVRIRSRGSAIPEGGGEPVAVDFGGSRVALP